MRPSYDRLTDAEYDRLPHRGRGPTNPRKGVREIPREKDCIIEPSSVRLPREEVLTMKPPTTDALRYAATVLGRECATLERLLDAADSPTGPAREQLRQLLAQVRGVRTWILGSQMPIATRREEKDRYHRQQVLATRPESLRKACTECGELLAFDHSVCFYCATGTRPATKCADCGAVLLNVIGPNVRGTVCPQCNPDSTLLEDEDDTHEPDCRCSECGDAPIRPEDLQLLRTSVMGLIPSPRAELKAISRDLKAIFGDHRCTHPNAAPAKEVPALSCPDCGAVFRKIDQ
jgi:hypothetical protein